MAFHEVLFPENISRGSRGGPQRRTQIVTLDSGEEERNASWTDSRRRYDVSYGIRLADQLAAVIAFFEARSGRLHGFRFRDPLDGKSCLPSATAAATDQSLGTGNAEVVAYALRRAYTSGGTTWYRPITKPVTGSVLIALDGTPTASGWTVDTTTGIVTFSAAPGNGVVVTAGFTFDVPVRFDSDSIEATADNVEFGGIDAIPLLEVRR